MERLRQAGPGSHATEQDRADRTQCGERGQGWTGQGAGGRGQQCCAGPREIASS